MTRLLAFTGPAGVGKDTAGGWFVDYMGWTRLSFATPIYKMLDAAGFGWPTTHTQKQKVIDLFGSAEITWRHLAQTLGTEWGRETIHPNIWVMLAERAIQEDPNRKFVITDLRFDNEAEMVRKNGGQIIHLFGRGIATGNDMHPSELGVKKMPGDTHLMNKGSLEEFLHYLKILSTDWNL